MDPIKPAQYLDVRSKDPSDKNQKTLYPVLAAAIMAMVAALGKGKKIPIITFNSKIPISGFLIGSSFFLQKSFCSGNEDRKFLIPLWPLIPLDDPFRKQVDEKLIGHESDPLIRGTSLEGSTIERNAQHLNAFTKLCIEKGTISSKTAQNLQDFFAKIEYIPTEQISFTRKRLAAYLASKVCYLQPEESFSMEGGWIEKGVGGHALLYVFTKKSEDLYDIYIYNTGLGIETYHTKIEVEEGFKKKTLICPYVKVEKVSLKKISNPVFFEKLIEVRQGLISNNPLDHVYNAFKALGKVAEPGSDTIYVTPQRSGTCSFKVLLAAMRSLFESEEEYKRYKFVLKYTDFLIFFENNQFSLLGKAYSLINGIDNPLQDNPSAKELLVRQGEKLLRSLEKLQDIFSKEEVKEAQDKIIAILTKAESKQKSDFTLDSIQYVQDRSGFGFENLYSQHVDQPIKGNLPIDKILYKEIILDPLSLSNIKDHLTKIDQTKEVSVAVYATEKLVEELLNFSKEDLAKIPKEEVKEIIDGLHKVFLRYMNIQNRSFLNQSQISRNTAWAFILKTYELASFLVPSLADFRMPHEILLKEAQGELYIESSKKEWDKFIKILFSFEKDKEKHKIFDLYQYVSFKGGDGFYPEEEFLKSLADPEWSLIDFLTGNTAPKAQDLKNRVELLIKKDRLTSLEGSLIVKLRDMVYFGFLSCFSADYRRYATFKPMHDDFSPHPELAGGGIYIHSDIGFSRIGLLWDINSHWKTSWGLDPWVFPKSSTFQNENNALINPLSRTFGHIYPAVVCNKALRCSKLLYFFSEDLLKLKDIKTQDGFFKFLFQMGGGVTGWPSIFEAVQDEAFIKQLVEFLEKGADFFISSSLTGRPDVVTSLFFARLLRRVREIDPSLPLPSFQDKINEWLRIPKLTKEELQLIHLHRIMQYKGRDIHSLQKTQLQEIFTSWILCRDHMFKEEGEGRSQKEEAFRFVFSLAPLIKTLSSDDLNVILSGVLGGKESDDKWTSTGFSLYKKGHWQMGLLSGQIMKDNVLLNLGSYKDLQPWRYYEHLFGKAQFSQIRNGHSYEFTDDTTGVRFRCLEGKLNTIQVLSQGYWHENTNRWYENEEKHLPAFIQSDHHSFSSGSLRAFLDKKTRKIAFIVTGGGTLVNAVTKNKISYQNTVSAKELDPFEDPAFRLHELDTSGKVMIRFPRFSTAMGNELCLVQGEGKSVVLKENPSFVLIKPIQDVIGVTKNILCFQNLKTKEIKIIVPIKPVTNDKKIDPSGNLSEEKEKEYRQMESQEKIYSFAEYALKEGKIIPKDREAKALLSYLYLCQKRDVESLSLLDGLGRDRALTGKVKDVVRWICEAPLQSANQTPAAIAIGLKAGLLLRRTGNIVDIGELVSRYKDTYNNIPAELRFSSRELEEIDLKYSSFPQGTSFRSLQKSLEEVNVPSCSTLPISKNTNIALLDLQKLFIEPYFRKVKPFKPDEIEPLQLPDQVPTFYEKMLKKLFDDVNKGIELGKKINEEMVFFTLKERVSLEVLIKDLLDTHQALKISLEKAKEDILLLARLGPQDALQAEKALRLEKGRVLSKVEFEELITRYIRGSYKDLNPHLRDDQLEGLDFKIREFLTNFTQMQQLERALQLKDVSLIPGCLQKMAYTPSTGKMERVFLVYEYRANLRIRDDQINAIQSMLEDKDALLQMMMGGGKTTVLTSILLEAVDPGKIVFFIPPVAQFETQVANLSEMQHRYYYKHIIPMNFSRKELTTEKLQWMFNKFIDALKYQETIVTTATTLESLQLEWISLLDRKSLTLSDKERMRINLLTQILRTLKTKGFCLIDEVDQILDLYKELNFPAGERVLIDQHYVDLIEKVFCFHLEPEIENSLGLLRNGQSSFPIEQYKEKILPKVADQLFEHYKKLFALDDFYKKAFLGFVLRGIEDKSFRYLLERKMKSNNLEEVRSAQLVFLTKGLFFHILPSIMSKTENKNYGIPKGVQDRKVIPFLGVDSPSNTEFAGPYETACYHNLTALSLPITAEQLHKVAVSLMEAVLPIVQYTGVKLMSTKEYHKFHHLTGASLERIYHKDPIVMQKTLDYLKSHPEKRLELEKFFILEYVRVHLNYYRSNSHSFYDLCSLKKGLTGTPWNHLTYPETLRNNMTLQEGLEGSIREVFLQRVDKGVSKVHITPTEDIQKILQIALQDNLRKNQFRALLDPVGFFKDKTNEEVAQEILTYFEQDSTIDTVLFFGRIEGNMGIPGTLMALRKPRGVNGKFSYEVIGGTEKEALEAKGINPENTVIYYDERHCEATDIPQIPNAFGLVMVGNGLLDRDFIQTNLRLREYLKNQDVDLILPENEKKNYAKITGRDILTQMEVTQGIKSADEGFISFNQKMDNIFRQKAIEMLLEDPIPETMEKIRDALVIKQDVSPYASFGLANAFLSPLEAFKANRKAKEAKFFYLMDDSIRLKLDHLQSGVEKNVDRLASLVPTFSVENSQQMEISVQKEITKEVTRQINQEIESEYKSYQTEGVGILLEKKMP